MIRKSHLDKLQGKNKREIVVSPLSNENDGRVQMLKRELEKISIKPKRKEYINFNFGKK